jgi:hypothetical protein
MRFTILFLLGFSISIFCQETSKYKTDFEKGNGNQSATYQETLDFFAKLDADFSSIKMQKMGLTDSGFPLHIVTFNLENNFDFDKIRKNKSIILINNAIHPGEPDGVDATMQLFRDLAIGKIKVPKNVVLVAIPVYNIGGMLNRNGTSRVNQNGPEEYGFRGNGRNFDLNRDLIKTDTKNTKGFVEIFHKVKPDIFIDNHVSNGADYQYTLTYIQTEPSKLGKQLGSYMQNQMTPSIVKSLESKDFPTSPYVNIWGTTPDKGFAQFYDSPRYTTGYASLFNTIGYVVETHMWKNYTKRVKATYEFMLATLVYVDKHSVEIKKAIIENSKEYKVNDKYPIQWKLDSSKVAKIEFLGYESGVKKSEVTNGERLFYDRNKPYKKTIPFYSNYKADRSIIIPKAYMIPQNWWTVIDFLKTNQCSYSRIGKDTLIEVESYKITDYKTAPTAYEGHYPHRSTKVNSKLEKVLFRKGDYVFNTNQKSIKFLLETLEPEAVDSYFNWNFFDTILQQKEGYSDYLFEDLAVQILKENPTLKNQLDQKIKEDATFANNPEAQLDYVYKNSVHYEKAHLQYPVYRLMK